MFLILLGCVNAGRQLLPGTIIRQSIRVCLVRNSLWPPHFPPQHNDVSSLKYDPNSLAGRTGITISSLCCRQLLLRCCEQRSTASFVTSSPRALSQPPKPTSTSKATQARSSRSKCCTPTAPLFKPWQGMHPLPRIFRLFFTLRRVVCCINKTASANVCAARCALLQFLFQGPHRSFASHTPCTAASVVRTESYVWCEEQAIGAGAHRNGSPGRAGRGAERAVRHLSFVDLSHAPYVFNRLNVLT